MSKKTKQEKKIARKLKEELKLLNRGTYGRTLVRGNGWHVKEKEKDVICSLVDSPVIYLEPIPRHKIEILMDEYPNQEWLGYLVGSVSEKKNVFVEDISIPPHENVSSVSAEAKPFNIPEKCVGIIHSHHHMGAFHSGTDQTYVDKNFLVSITVARGNQGLSFDAVNNQKTPCGKTVTGKSVVKYVRPEPSFDVEVFLTEAKANIDMGKTVVGYQYGSDLWSDEDESLFSSSFKLTGNRPLYRPASVVRKQLTVGETLYFNRNGVVVTQAEADKLDREEL